MPEMLVMGRSSARGASADIFSRQSVSRARSGGGRARPRAQNGVSTATIPERSPARMPGASSSSAVVPPRNTLSPRSIRLSGRAAKCQARTSSAAPAFARSIASLSGMRLVAACVVPEELAK